MSDSDKDKEIERLRSELTTQQSARMVERAALEFYMIAKHWLKQPHHACSAIVADTGARAGKALSQPPPELEAVVRCLVDAAKGVLWVDECRCRDAWTGRDMHEPNSKCGELDPLREALARVAGELERMGIE